MTVLVEAWDALDAKAQEASARVVADMLLAAGFPLEFKALQPVAQQRRVAVYFDRKHELDWVLVPGGLQRGWGVRERKLIGAAVKKIEGWRLEEGEPLPDVESVRPYGAETFSFDSMFKADVELGPFLTTAMPLLGTTKQLPAPSKRSRLLARGEKPSVFSVLPDELDSFLVPRGWRLPTADQSQWMSGAGRFVFPWGDELPDDLTDSFEEKFYFHYEAPAPEWRHANAFGLIHALVASHWVRDGEQLAWSGGTAECYPWQACGEWAGFLTAAVVPQPAKPEPWESHSLRPVIELAAL